MVIRQKEAAMRLHFLSLMIDPLVDLLSSISYKLSNERNEEVALMEERIPYVKWKKWFKKNVKPFLKLLTVLTFFKNKLVNIQGVSTNVLLNTVTRIVNKVKNVKNRWKLSLVNFRIRFKNQLANFKDRVKLQLVNLKINLQNKLVKLAGKIVDKVIQFMGKIAGKFFKLLRRLVQKKFNVLKGLKKKLLNAIKKIFKVKKNLKQKKRDKLNKFLQGIVHSVLHLTAIGFSGVALGTAISLLGTVGVST